MSSNQAPQQLSIFEEAKDGSLPVKPVRTEHDFGVPQRRSLSATGIQSRIKQFVRQEVVANLSETLTPREREILALVASGLMNKQIASVLRLSENTVKIHREHIIEKMDASSSADLARKADTLGIHRTEP